MTELELASLRAEEGATVVQRNGRFWSAISPGFYQPIHLLARLRAAEIGRPARSCWGYRAALTDEDAHLANGSIPVHLLPDVARFTEGGLNRNRRRDLRTCRQEVELIRLGDPSLLFEQGHDVYMSAVRRVAYWPPLTETEYRRRIRWRSGDRRRLIVAGLIDGRLVGYLESYAVDGVLYTHGLFVATEALPFGIGTGLYVETIKIAARDGRVLQVCVGLHTPEKPDLCAFKAGLGFRVAHVPARTAIPAPIGAYIRARRPAVYYRLTGLKPAAAKATGE